MAVERVSLKLVSPLHQAIAAEAAKCDLDVQTWIEATLLTAWRSPSGLKIKIPAVKSRREEPAEETPVLPFGQE